MPAAKLLPGEQAQSRGHAGHRRGTRIGPKQTRQAGGGRSEDQAASQREYRGVSASTLLQAGQGRRRVEFTPAHLLQDLVDSRLNGHVVAQLPHRLQGRPSPARETATPR